MSELYDKSIRTLELPAVLEVLGLAGNLETAALMERIARHIGQGARIAGVGELVHVDHAPSAGRKHLAHHGRADEARAARNQKSMRHQFILWGRSIVICPE